MEFMEDEIVDEMVERFKKDIMEKEFGDSEEYYLITESELRDYLGKTLKKYKDELKEVYPTFLPE